MKLRYQVFDSGSKVDSLLKYTQAVAEKTNHQVLVKSLFNARKSQVIESGSNVSSLLKNIQAVTEKWLVLVQRKQWWIFVREMICKIMSSSWQSVNQLNRFMGPHIHYRVQYAVISILLTLLIYWFQVYKEHLIGSTWSTFLRLSLYYTSLLMTSINDLFHLRMSIYVECT